MTLPISWANAHCATCDDAGNVYVLTSQSEEDWALTSLDASLRVRWRAPSPARWAYMASARKLELRAWSSSGALVIWVMGQPTAYVVSCVDGRTLGTIRGGDANVDLAGAESLAVDRDGSLVTVTRGVLRRHSIEGQPMPLWEGGAIAQLALSSEETPRGIFAFVGWDGATWVTTHAVKGMLWGENWDTIQPRWRRFDRRGQTLGWSDRYFLLYEADGAWADRAGHPFSVWTVAASYPRLVRYAQDLNSFEYWLVASSGPPVDPKEFDGEKVRTTREPSRVAGENVLALAPDGAIWAFGSMSRLRYFGPERNEIYVSPAG
jgi:hypothetical protein